MLLEDFSYAMRQLRRAPGFAFTVVLTLGLSVGVATAVFFHTNFTDPDQIFHFIKNVVMTGGLLQIVAFGAGALSIDNRR